MARRGLALVFALTFAAAAFAADPIDTRAVDRLMNDTIRAWQIPGAAIAIVKDDRVVYVKGYGVKELGKPDAVTPDTLFQIASTSKAFTTTALAMLVDAKKLDWDDPVRKHLDYFRLADPCADSMVTVRDIVSHRTGLSRHDELWDNTPLTRDDVVRRIGFVPLSKSFRSAYQYQNIMFIAAGEVVTHASGMSWDDFVRTRIFEPLQMAHTVTSDADWNRADHASGHKWNFKLQATSLQAPIDTTTIGSGGAIKSSARDMANWLRFQLADGAFDGKRLVDATTLNETKTPQTVIRLEDSARESNPESNLEAYGMGWVIQDYKGELLVSHAGALNGFRTHVDLLPKQHMGFVVLLNAGRGYAGVALRNALADLLLSKPTRDWSTYYLDLDHREDTKAETKKREAEAKIRRGTKPSRELAAYAGTYTSPGYGTATITVDNDTLTLHWLQLDIPLAHEQFDTFRAVSEKDDVDEQVAFALNPSGDVETVTVFGETFRRSP